MEDLTPLLIEMLPKFDIVSQR